MPKFFASLITRLKADTKGYESGMRRASNSTLAFHRDARRLATSLQSLAAGFVGFSAIRVGVRHINSAMKELDEVAKSADRVGIATESLIALNLAAEESGSSAESMQKFVERLLKSVGEMQFKIFEGADVFKRI